jgi:hypothetical protein
LSQQSQHLLGMEVALIALGDGQTLFAVFHRGFDFL